MLSTPDYNIPKQTSKPGQHADIINGALPVHHVLQEDVNDSFIENAENPLYNLEIRCSERECRDRTT